MKYALIELAKVVNVIVWDGETDVEGLVPKDSQLVAVPSDVRVEIGDGFVEGVFVPQDVPEQPAPPAPRVVTMRQARLALLEAGKLAAVGAAIATLASPLKDVAQIEWEYAATVDRDSALMGLLGAALQLDEAELDALFSKAASL